MSWIDVVGYSAALAVLAAFCMSSIVPLRIVAILSNVLFALYGLSAHLYPVFLLHSILLPINVFKLKHVESPPPKSRFTVGNRLWSRPLLKRCPDRRASRSHGMGRIKLTEMELAMPYREILAKYKNLSPADRRSR